MLKKRYVVSAALAAVGIIVACTLLSTDRVAGLNTGFNIVRTFAVIGTFAIALVLFDRYGLKKNLKSRQLDLMLDLAECVREAFMRVSASGPTYMVTFKAEQVAWYEGSGAASLYARDSQKTLVVDPGDYAEGMKPILSYKSRMLTPTEVVQALQPFDYAASADVTFDPDQHALLFFSGSGNPSDRPTGLMLPEMTFGRFNSISEELVQTIERWIREHSDESFSIAGGNGA